MSDKQRAGVKMTDQPLVTPQKLLDDALASEKGLKVTFSTQKAARQFRVQCYTVIRNERMTNKRELGQEYSEYDSLILSIADNDLIVKFRAQELSVTYF